MLTLDEIHERLAAHLTAALAVPEVEGPWRESLAPNDLFPLLDSTEIEHHGFALGFPISTPDPADRQRLDHIRTTTTVSIRWGHRIRADAVAFDTKEALKAERELTAAARRIDNNPGLHVDVAGWSRSTSRDGLLFFGELLLRVVHLYPV